MSSDTSSPSHITDPKPKPALSPVFTDGGAPAAKRPQSPGRTIAILVGCNALVFLSSVCVMVLELTASRLIAKSHGSSLYTWTSVIGVVLAGISLGNFLGGWLADRFPPRRVLAYVFWASSVCCLSVYTMHGLIAASERPEWFSWPAWVLLAVAAVFLVPALALGTISPLVASIALAQSERTGTTVGNVYAWGALGSILGTFLTGFFLIDHFGTQHIIWMTSATLAILGAIVATGQWAFRAAVLCGWLQFVLWVGLFASSREAYAADNVHAGEDGLTRALHQVGLKLGLRRDDPDEYHDESNYSYINVDNQNVGGEEVRTLHLDHLTHSYFNPQKPTELYYEYERVYAAITERAAETWKRPVESSAVGIPPEILARLPSWAKYDADRKVIRVDGAINADRRDDLLALSPLADFWIAVDDLSSKDPNDPFTAMKTTPLKALPPGVTIPDSLDQKLRYDENLQMLVRYRQLSSRDVAELLAAGGGREFRDAVENLYQRSRQVSTFFIGGGGFVFPRWIEAKFPYQPHIDVAELDPAVKLAVQLEMGLPADGKTAVHTYIGDARNVVDDLRRANARRKKDGQAPVLYDFVYGDAFNDFSVPWHLTTREFTEKVRDLLNDEGVYLVNIIDIYPRAEYPGRPAGAGEAEVQGRLPASWKAANAKPDAWTQVPKHRGLFVQSTATGYRLKYEGVMKGEARNAMRLDCSNPVEFGLKGDMQPNSTAEQVAAATIEVTPGSAARDAVEDLYDQTNEPLVVTAKLPAAWLPLKLNADWEPAPEPFQNLEVRRVDHLPNAGEKQPRTGGVLLGWRGVMSDADRARLLQAAGENAELRQAVEGLAKSSRQQKAGRFLGSYSLTASKVFPCIYVFSSNEDQPSALRDTFVVACSRRPLDLSKLYRSGGYWRGQPFGWLETGADGKQQLFGQMEAVLALARALELTDDFAPVDNLLAPVFVDQ